MTLLSLPGSIQANIYRYVLYHKGEYIVFKEQPGLCRGPSLLKVSKDVRAVARPIFYRETAFQCLVVGFDVISLQPWVKIRQEAMQATAILQEVSLADVTLFMAKPGWWQRSHQGQMAEYMLDVANSRSAPPLPPPTSLFWAIDDSPDWSNLMYWLKLYHAEKIEGYKFHGDVEVKHRVLKSLFGIVRSLRGQRWSVVMEVLEEARAALSAVERGWVEEYDEAIQKILCY